MLSFLFKLLWDSLEQIMEVVDIKVMFKVDVDINNNLDYFIMCLVKDGMLIIGNIQVLVFNLGNKMKVLDVFFYENFQYLVVMEDMLKDFILGEYLLLVGNQGVGKNKIVDCFFYLMNKFCEYI